MLKFVSRNRSYRFVYLERKTKYTFLFRNMFSGLDYRGDGLLTDLLRRSWICSVLVCSIKVRLQKARLNYWLVTLQIDNYFTEKSSVAVASMRC